MKESGGSTFKWDSLPLLRQINQSSKQLLAATLPEVEDHPSSKPSLPYGGLTRLGFKKISYFFKLRILTKVLSSLEPLASFMRLSLPKAAHTGVGECRVAGNPGALRS